MSPTTIVVPCYNEARRLPVEQFRAFVCRSRRVDVLFVNDGSTDGTQEVLEQLQAHSGGRCQVRHLPKNVGKAEAVRQGCLAAFAAGAALVGYWDADLSTPLRVLPRFLRVLQRRPQVHLVCGARVQLLGRSVRRNPVRHYLGRAFATAASLTLGLPIYDTQCGAKLFRASQRLRAAFAEPFQSRWLFDVEILARLQADGQRPGAAEIVYEYPLPQWHDVAGSKVKPTDFPKALLELAGIYWKYRPGFTDLPTDHAGLKESNQPPRARYAAPPRERSSRPAATP